MERNYFYCPSCGFEYLTAADYGYFGESVHRYIPNNSVNGKQIDYLMHCPRCNAKTCGVIRMSETEDKVTMRSIIALHMESPAIKNAP